MQVDLRRQSRHRVAAVLAIRATSPPTTPSTPPKRVRAPNTRPTHLPIHASWLSQIELFFSIVQRKALTPNDFGSVNELAERLLALGEHNRHLAQPFQWTFTRADLDALLARLAHREPHLRLAA